MWSCICLWLKIATHPSEAFCATHAKMGRRNGRGWWQWGVQLSYEREVALHLHGLSLCTFHTPLTPPTPLLSALSYFCLFVAAAYANAWGMSPATVMTPTPALKFMIQFFISN